MIRDNFDSVMTTTQKHTLFKKAFLIRKVEERLLELFEEGKINGTVHTCIGQEFTGVYLAEYITQEDIVLSNHRGHGHFLARNTDLVGFFAELMGRTSGICGGFGGSQHFYTSNHISNGIQGGMAPIGLGLAYANKLQKNDRIVVNFIGDGTLGQGVIYESFNIASKWEVPIIYILENNEIAQSTSLQQTFAGDIEARAKGFGLAYFETHTQDVKHLASTFEKATLFAREQQKAVFIQVKTIRLNSHSKGDDNRDPKIIQQSKEKDVLNLFQSQNTTVVEKWLHEIERSIEQAIFEAEQAEKLTYIQKDLEEVSPIYFRPHLIEASSKRINQHIHDSLRTQFQKASNTVFIGEDIEYHSAFTYKPYGGAFKVSNTLSKDFENIRNTPISEAAIIGVGTGLALAGMRPIVEIMFGDFLTLTFDQLYNHACKFYRMFNKKINVPLVIRTPMGGKRGYGPTHSQSLEKHFLGMTDLKIIVLNERVSPNVIYEKVFKEKHPTLIIENKILYTKTLNASQPIGYNVHISNENYPTLRISPQQKIPDITILCYGELLGEVEKAVDIVFWEEEVLCEIICPSCIQPIHIEPIEQSILRTNALITIEEGTNIAAYSSEVVTLLLERNNKLKAIGRLSNNGIIPSALEAELNVIANIKSIVKKIKEVYNNK